MQKPLRRTYSKATRAQAVKEATQPGAVRAEIALRLGIHDQVLARWVREKLGSSIVDEAALKTSSLPTLARNFDLEKLKEKLANAIAERDLLRALLTHYLTKGTS